MKTLILFLSVVTFLSCTKYSSERIETVTDANYAGDYTSLGYYYHPLSPRNINRPKTVWTHSSDSYICEIGDIPSFVADDSAWSVILQIDENSNNVTISSFPGAGNGPQNIIMFSSGLPSPYISQWLRSSECTNIYDPLTKEFKLRYGYYEANNSLRVVEEIIKQN